MNSNCDQAAVVVNRLPSNNPNIYRCQFFAVPSTLAFMEKPIVIYGGPQKSYYENGFNEWLEKTCKFRITYKDGLVFMFQK